MDDATLVAKWRLMQGDRQLFAIPRVAMLRSVVFTLQEADSRFPVFDLSDLPSK